MKSIEKFLSELRRLDVKLWLDGENLRCKAPKEVMSPNLRAQLKEHKPEIIISLREADSALKSLESSIRPVSRQAKLPLSFAQQRLWFLSQLEPDSPGYNVSKTYRLRGKLDINALEKSLQAIINRHEILRTNFIKVDGEPIQIIQPKRNWQLKLVDLANIPQDQIEAEVKQLAIQEVRQLFNLAENSLIRAQLLTLNWAEHILLLTIHHIVYDEWSSNLLYQELITLYKAFASGETPTLSPLPIQYADFAVWQRQRLQGDYLKTEIDYWQQKLSGTLPILNLPADYPRPQVQTHNGTHLFLELSSNLSQQIKSLSQEFGVTPFMTLLTAFNTLLHRYSDQNDIMVGSPIANRDRSEIEGLIGFFVNTLVLRTQFSENQSFKDLLVQVRQTLLEAYNHQNLPFEKLVEELQPERDTSRSPFFQVMFVFQNAQNSESELSDLSIQSIELDSYTTAKFDLTLYIIETAQGFKSVFEYNTDLFTKETIARMAGHWQTLLEGIVANPQQRIKQLPMLTAAEQQQLLIDWNDTQADYPDLCIHQLFEQQVEKTPELLAIRCEEQELTYLQLNERANQLAHYLQKLGVKPDTLVGICVERSPEMIVGLLGILKAGGAYVPIDPTYPQERLDYIVEDSQIDIVLVQTKYQSNFTERNIAVIDLETTISKHSSSPTPSASVTPNNLAYVIYTSGSTGKPKGVMNAHQGVVNRLLWMQYRYQLTTSDRILQKTPFSFDVSVWEFFWTLSTGATLVIAKPEGHKDSVYLTKIIQTEQITTLHFVPSMLKVFLEAREVEQCQSLTRVICSGEELPKELENRFFKRLQCELHNLYGPTEAAIDVTAWQCQPESKLKTVPIGKAIANTQIYILDQNLKPVPIGVSGELHIGGIQVAKGYLNRPELTAEKFIPNPFNQKHRLYKTGDLARYLPDGNIEYLGRIDNQVKIRGFRIELGEIESALAEYPELEQNVVIAREDIPGDKRLVAYVVPKQDRTLKNKEIRSFLQEKLPGYMIPGFFVWLETIPLTPNGKIDRRVLPQPEVNLANSENIYIQPKTKIETKIAAIWREVLKIDKVGIYDNFFDLGGHSLLIAQVQTKVTEVLEKEISILDMFTFPTIHALAQKLTTESSPDFVSETNANRATNRKTRQDKMNRQRQHRRLRRSTN